MSTLRLAVFQGVDSTAGPVIIPDVAIFPGDKILSIATLSPAPDANDWAAVFAPVFAGVAAQSAGHNFSGRTFIALIQSL